MDVKRLKSKHGAINGKLMAMVHDRTDIAAIERFFSMIGAELALIICQSLRGFFTIRPIGGSKHVKNIRWRPEILFWLMACYNNPMFAKTYHIGWKYGGYEEDSLAVRSQRGRRNRAEMISFLDYYTLKKFDGGWHRTLPGGIFTFSFMDIEPSYHWVCADDSCVFNVNWHGIKKAICRYPYPTSISTASSQWAYIQSYDLSAEYYTEDGCKLIITKSNLTPDRVKRIFDSNFHIKVVDG